MSDGPVSVSTFRAVLIQMFPLHYQHFVSSVEVNFKVKRDVYISLHACFLQLSSSTAAGITLPCCPRQTR